MFVCYDAHQLPVPGFDGELAEIRLGTGPDAHAIRMGYDRGRGKWVSDPITVMRSTGQKPLRPVPVADNRGIAGRAYLAAGGDTTAFNGTDTGPLLRCGLALARGLKVEHKLSAFLHAPTVGTSVSAGVLFYAVKQGDMTGIAGTSPGTLYFATPPVGGKPASDAYIGWAETAYVAGGTDGAEHWAETGWAPLQGPIDNTTGLHQATFDITQASDQKTDVYPAPYVYLTGGTGFSVGEARHMTCQLRYTS